MPKTSFSSRLRFSSGVSVQVDAGPLLPFAAPPALRDVLNPRARWRAGSRRESESAVGGIVIHSSRVVAAVLDASLEAAVGPNPSDESSESGCGWALRAATWAESVGMDGP
jgi:hypothetical protein